MASKSAAQVAYNPDDHPDDKGKLAPGPGRESFKLASFWKEQVNLFDRANGPWQKKGARVIRRYRDERSRAEREGTRRMNILWANIKVMKPAIYSKCPIPVIDRKFLDRDPVGRLSSQMLERSVHNEIESNYFHEAITAAVYDRLLPGRGVVWVRYEPSIGSGPSIPAPTVNGIEDPILEITGDVDHTESEQELEDTGQQVVAEKVICDYIDWRDFYTFPVKARTWSEVQAIGKKLRISKHEAIERFGKKIGSKLQADTSPMNSGNDRITYDDNVVFSDVNERSIIIYEIWNKSDQKVYWVSTGYEYLCDVKDDPLRLKDFFPTPRPLNSTVTSDTLTPVPDYLEWQDQAIQIDELTQRIAMLTRACKIAGAYNAASPALGRILEEGTENKLIPVDQWAMFAEMGGLKGSIDLLPLDQIQACIATLQQVRQQCQIDLDQVTGISDIIRGTSDSRETLGGIRLKNNNAGTRLSESQEEVARFARDAIALIAEVVSKHFSDETIIESSGILFEDELQPEAVLAEWEAVQPPTASAPPAPTGAQPQIGPEGPTQSNLALPGPPGPVPGAPTDNNVVPFPGGPAGGAPSPQNTMGMPTTPLIPQPPDAQVLIFEKIDKAIKLLREDVRRGYRIDIETDSTILGDQEKDRQNVNDFMVAVGGFFAQSEKIVQSVPEAGPLLGKMLQWAVRRYRTGRDLESEIDTFVTKMDKKAKHLAANPPPDPEQQKAQAELQLLQAQGAMEAQNDQRAADMQIRNDERDHQMAQAEDDRQAQLSKLKIEQEERKMQMQAAIDQRTHQMTLEQMDREATYKEAEHKHKMEQLVLQAEENEKKRAEAKKKAAQPKKKAS